MKRPLFAAALLLVAVVWIKLSADGRGFSAREAETGQPETGTTLYVTGQVCRKEEQKIWLQSVAVYQNLDIFQKSEKSRQEFNYSEQESGKSKQESNHSEQESGKSKQESNHSEQESDKSGQEFNDSEQKSHSLQTEYVLTQNISYTGKIICEVTGDTSKLPLGSRVAVVGVFAPFSEASNPGEFDTKIYYRSLGVGGRLRKAEILAAGKKYWHVRETAWKIRQYLCVRMNRILPPEHAGVMCALLLGDKAELDGELKDLYKRNGILHILSISSLHITIIGMGVYRLLRKAGIPVVPAAVAGAMLLLFYGAMTGFSISACRAIGMYLLRMGAEVVGRSYDMLTALGVLAAGMVLGNPCYLQNTGFLLSFSSVLGIGGIYPALAGRRRESVSSRYYGEKKWRLWVRKAWQSLKDAFFASFSITLTTLPIQLWYYYEVPTHSVFLNLMVLPLMKPLLATGILSLVPGLGFAGGIAGIILQTYEVLCTFFDGLPFRTWNPGRPKVWQIAVYYGILAATVMLEEKRRQREKEEKGMKGRRAGGAGDWKKGYGVMEGKAGRQRDGKDRFKREKNENEKMEKAGNSGKMWRRGRWIKHVALAAALLLLSIRPGARDRIVFLDVGQGDCCLVQTASGENYIFDCGSSNRGSVGRYVLLPCLKYYGIREIDAVFVSHPDTDHMNGIVELLELAEDNCIEVKQLILPAIESEARKEQFSELQAAAGNIYADSLPSEEKESGVENGVRGAARKEICVTYLAAGEGWERGAACFTCLHPAEGYPAENVNAYSQCIYACFETFSLLLTGDVEEEGEAALLKALREREITDVTILKVAHHGSRNSTSSELLAQVNPRLAVISCGKNNRYGHPHEELLERLRQTGGIILQTSEAGAVTVQREGSGVKVWGYRR